MIRDDDASKIHIVGSAHISQQSCNEVQSKIRSLHASGGVSGVCVELCNQRTAILLKQDRAAVQLSVTDALKRIKGGENIFGILYSMMLSRIGAELEIMPGAEFKAAREVALEHQIRFFLIDRPVRITILRIWAALSLWEKIKLSATLLKSALQLPSAEEMKAAIEQMKEPDFLLMAMEEFGREFPSLLPPLLAERDLYMVSQLRKISDDVGGVTVAVVGAGHLKGIVANWETEIDVNALIQIPVPRNPSVGKWLIRIGVFSIAGYALYHWRK